MNNISDFIDDFVPKNLPKGRRILLKTEMENHIYEKMDFYKEIGYSDEESQKKAIDDFGTDNEMKNSIFNELEALYAEKSIWGILSFFAILLMNYLCFPLGVWVTSADFNDDPSPLTALISFSMIFAVCGLIILARMKKYRKMLACIGVANLIIGVILFFNFYSQCAVYSIAHNLVYLIDVFTPASIGDYIVYGEYNIVPLGVWESIPFIFAIYCFISAVKIKRGTAKNIINVKKKILTFTAVFSVVTIITCCLLPTGLAYSEDYKVWFDEYYNYISDESRTVFESVSIGDSYYDVSQKLVSQGYTTAKAYEEKLDRIDLKQFRNSYEKFGFADGYEVWFKTENRPSGNGFVGIKNENGVITAKAAGNLEQEMYTSKKYEQPSFGYTEIEFNHDMSAVQEYFGTLEKGDIESEVMSRFGVDLGSVYSKRFSVENGIEKHYYRIYCYGIVYPQKNNWFEKRGERYVELSFEDGKLVSGSLYEKIMGERDYSVYVEHIN